MSNVLFVCVANSGRSVMAERLFRQAAGGRHEARSAGSDPGPAVHPQVLEALRSAESASEVLACIEATEMELDEN